MASAILNWSSTGLFQNQCFHTVKENGRYYCKSIRAISLKDVTNGIKKTASYALNKFLLLIKNIMIINAIAQATLLLMIIASPLAIILPPANSIFPKLLVDLIYVNLCIPTVILTEFLTKMIPRYIVTFNHGIQGTVNLSSFLAVGIAEEFVFRGVIQQGLLEELPKMVLKKFAPNHLKSVDHIISRLARVIFTSFLFALAHAAAFGNQTGMLLPQFIGGVVYSVLTEKKISLTKLACAHAWFDIIIICILGGFPI